MIEMSTSWISIQTFKKLVGKQRGEDEIPFQMWNVDCCFPSLSRLHRATNKFINFSSTSLPNILWIYSFSKSILLSRSPHTLQVFILASYCVCEMDSWQLRRYEVMDERKVGNELRVVIKTFLDAKYLIRWNDLRDECWVTIKLFLGKVVWILDLSKC